MERGDKMEKNKAIPPGYMTVGQVAGKTGVTVRTLQYYDKMELLSPSAESEGGRRLYTDKDVVRLHQILSMKSLGFSLDDIKNRLIPLDTPEDVAEALSEQAAALREKIDKLTGSLEAIDALKEEVLMMNAVDFGKYADIVVNLQMKNEYYWLIKNFDNRTLDHFRSRFDKDSGRAMLETFTSLQEEAVRLQREGVSPESGKGQRLAKAYWEMVTAFTDGDMSMLSNLMEAETFEDPKGRWKEKQAVVHSFIEPALEAYFAKTGYDPFAGGHKDACQTD